MKWGLGDSYDNVSVLSKKGRAYIDLCKPASTLGIGIGVVLASYFYGFYTDTVIGLQQVVYVSVTAAAAHAGSQAMNMSEDAHIDRNTPHKQNRPIPSGVVSEEEARTIAWILMIFALGRGYLYNQTFGVMVSILVFMGIFYNLRPIRAKERVVSIPWQAVSRGLFFFPTIWAAYGDPLALEAWALGVFMFFYVLGFQNTADIIDQRVDEEYGISTFVVMFGVKRTAVISSGCVLMMIATVLLSIEYGVLESNLASLFLIVPFCILMLYYMTFYSDEVSDKTGNHPAYLWFYAGMVLIVTLPLASEVF